MNVEIKKKRTKRREKRCSSSTQQSCICSLGHDIKEEPALKSTYIWYTLQELHCPKTRLYGQKIGNIHLFFYVNLFPPILNFIAKSLRDDTPVKQAEILAQTRPCTISWSKPGYPASPLVSRIQEVVLIANYMSM